MDVFERVLTLVFVLAVLAGGGYVVVKKFSGGHDVSAADRARMVAAVAKKAPGAAFMSTKCGGSANNGGCTIYVRKGATHTCDGWLATIGADGQVALVGVGRKRC